MKSRKRRWSLALRYILLLLGGAVSVMPMIYMISTSLKPNGALYEFPPKFFPALDTITIENYVYIFSQEKFYINFLNSVIVAVLTVVIAAFVSSALAFCLARFRFPGRKALFALVMLTIGGFNVFTSIKMITDGKPMHQTDTVLTWMYYKAFSTGEFGYAAALSFIVAVTLMALAFLQFRAMKRQNG